MMQIKAIRQGQDGDASFPRYDDQSPMQSKTYTSRSHAGRCALKIEKAFAFRNY
jgi:hypothetical protein